MLTITCEEAVSASIKGSKAQVLLIGCKISDSQYHVLSVTSDGGNNITEKAKQISSTLPGGIYVLGVAMDTNPKQLKTQLNLVRGLLASIKKKSRGGGGGGRDQSLLIYYSQESKKLRCLSVDIDDPQSVLQLPGSEVKATQKELLVGHAYLSFATEQVIEIKGRDANATGISGVLNDTLDQCVSSLRDAVAISDGGSIPKNDECVSEYVRGNCIEVKFNWKNNASDVDSPFVISDGLNVKVEDGLHCKAYVHAQAKWQQLVELLKEDAIKTLTIRKEAILTELVGDGEEESEEGEKRKSWKTFKLMFPRRIWFKDESKKYELCEIVFPEENEEEAKENLKEIWGEGIILTLSHGDDKNRNGEEFKPISTTTKSQSDIAMKPDQKRDSKPSNLTYYLLAILVLLLAIAVIILLL
ncbi:PREDICTED: uncharacterized protein LOC100634829 isoform X1 [Amphimedon queenslandica]|uniref:Uncharacterized protein n=2 Tax=Amphimedon queenslandica TaxID=400682 RepID=A0A1X7TTK3_AMPQE|nr:PREDICTED: uncharacterized protein LOC100634829 isoform X1 [Amphimedon queenslandica]|eukprot:XP_003389824.3 PREDICTED: uncharacterized protein LOC100634829 isoform X1 [Amphimedon queenslandica]